MFHVRGLDPLALAVMAFGIIAVTALTLLT
jgi:hypothetical protein